MLDELVDLRDDVIAPTGVDSAAETTPREPKVGAMCRISESLMSQISMTALRGRQSNRTVRLGFLTLLDQGVTSATNFLTGVFIGRICTKEDFGLYMLGSTLVLFAMSAQLWLISTPYMIVRPRLKGELQSRYAGSTLLHSVALSALAALILAAAGVPLVHGIGPKGLAGVVWVLVAVVSFILLREYARRVCFANLQIRAALLLDCGVAILQIGGLAFLARHALLSPASAYCVIGGACGLAGIWWLAVNRAAFVPRLKAAVSDFERNWAIGRWVCASGLLWAISTSSYP